MNSFAILAKVVTLHIGEFGTQELSNTAWAFATAGRPAPAMLDRVIVLTIAMQETKHEVACS